MKKLSKKLALILGIFAIGVAASIFTEHYFFPWLSSTKFFSKTGWLKKAAENVTIINKTEQITIREEESIDRVVSRTVSSVVNIISIPAPAPASSTPAKIPRGLSGTGVIVTGDGLVVTHKSAVNLENSSYAVLAHDGNKYDAELAGYDEFMELAYLKINTTNLNPAVFANSDDIEPGRKTVAISNSSVEYENKYASGLISGINRTFNIAGKSLSFSDKLEGVFECDYLNNKSFIGGPVITYNGELAGIIGSTVVDNREIFYVIPSNQLKKSVDLAIAGDSEKRPALGLYYHPLSREYSIESGLDRDRGALVYSVSGKESLAVISGSAAEKAGLKINDIITAVGGREIDLNNPLANLVSEHKAGDKIELTVWRAGKEIKIPAQL